MKGNSMRDIRIEKVVLNVGCGTKLKPELAKTMLEKISGKKAVITITRKRSTFNVPGMQYDHTVGILVFDVSVALERRGYRVKKKKLSKKIGKRHAITKEEAIDFVKNRFNVQIISEKEIEEE